MRLPLGLGLIGLLLGCGGEPERVFVDPPIKVSEGLIVDPVSGDPAVELGFYNEQLYSSLADGEEAPVVFGLQDGRWTMPAIRITGIGSPATVSCTVVVVATSEQVSQVEEKARFVLSPDGFLEVQSFPIPIIHAAPNEEAAIDDLFGVDADISCSVVDKEGRGSSVTVRVTLVEG